MKKKLSILSTVIIAQSYGATNVVIQNTSLPNEGTPIVDNTGAPIALDDLSLSVGTFTPGFDFAALDNATQDQAVLDAFTSTGTTLEPSGGIAGLFVTAVSDADAGNSLAGQAAFLLVQDTSAAAAQVLVFDLGAVFPTQGATGDGSIPGRVLSGADLVFGATGISVDQGSYPPPLQTAAFATGVTFDGGGVIPEPSTSLLAALAGLGLVARRRR